MVARLIQAAKSWRQTIRYRNFLASGNRPWSPGYDTHKQKQIVAALSDEQLNPAALPAHFGWRLDERIVEYSWFFANLPAGKGRLLDAGSVLNFDYLLAHPKLREKSVFISTLAPESHAFWKEKVSYVYEDFRDSCFRDGYFDWVCCLSTLEHVGLDNTMLYSSDPSKREKDSSAYPSFLKEIRRVLTPGGTLFLSVPFGMATNHGWFQVFDSAMADGVIEEFAPSVLSETVFQYLPEGWVNSTREKAKDALYFDMHATGEYDRDHAAAARAVVCFKLQK